MRKDILVVAPHPDDETLGCGGLLHKAAEQGHSIHWLIMTTISEAAGYSPAQVSEKSLAIESVAKSLRVCTTTQLQYPPAQLDTIARQSLIKNISAAIRKIEPTHLYLPYPGDAHSDHRVVFEASMACTKWFRHPSILQVFVYETLSETGFGLDPSDNGFRPNHYENIGDHLTNKLQTLAYYSSELGAFPFPRSLDSVTALAKLRGCESGYNAAEALMILRSRHA